MVCSNAINQRAQLQLTADATAHDALYTLNSTLTATADEAKSEALALGDYNMPSAVYGEVLTASDIEFGVWDRATRRFTPDKTRGRRCSLGAGATGMRRAATK